MRVEAKHGFFKRIVRQTGCFKNILLTLANKHQLMFANHLHESNASKPSFSVTTTRKVSLENLNIELVINQWDILDFYPLAADSGDTEAPFASLSSGHNSQRVSG